MYMFVLSKGTINVFTFTKCPLMSTQMYIYITGVLHSWLQNSCHVWNVPNSKVCLVVSY